MTPGGTDQNAAILQISDLRAPNFMPATVETDWLDYRPPRE